MLLSRKHSQGVSAVMLTFIQITCVIMNYRKVIRSVFERKQCNECKVHLLTLDIPEGFLVMGTLKNMFSIKKNKTDSSS